MKRLILIMASIALSASAFSQGRHLGAYYTVAQTYRSLPNKYQHSGFQDKKTIGFNVGLSYTFLPNKSFHLLSGIDYSVSGYDRIVYGTISSPTYTLKSRLHYAGVPTLLEKTIISRKISLSFDVGAIHKLIIAASYQPYDVVTLPWYMPGPPSYQAPAGESFSSKDFKAMGYRTYNIDLMAGIKAGVSLKSFTVGLMPEFRHALLSTTKGYSKYHTPKEQLYSYGIKIFASL